MILLIWKIGWGYNPDGRLPHQRLTTLMAITAPTAVKNPDGGISSDLPPIYPFGVFDRRKGKFAALVSASAR